MPRGRGGSPNVNQFMRTGKPRNQANNRQFWLESMYRRVLGELCMNRFEWKGFDGTGVDIRYLEMMLYQTALSVVYKDDGIKNARTGALEVPGTGQIYALRAAPSGPKNLTDNPIAFTLSGPNFQGRRVKARDCVPIWGNYFRAPDIDIVEIYAYKLARLDRTIEINSDNARRSKALVYNETQQLTARNINDMFERGEATIPVNLGMGDTITAVDLGVDPKSIEALSILRARIWNECMGLLGINNSNQDKKERLVAAEVSANDDQVGSARRVNLNARQDAAKAITKKFGIPVSVDYYSDQPVETVNPLTNEQTGTGGA